MTYDLTYINILEIDVRRLIAAAITAAQIFDLVSLFIRNCFKG
jgi:hypothetical protein